MSAVCVYRAFDAVGVLLYVGRTNNLPARLRAHRRERPWWAEVARWSVDVLPNDAEAATAERLAIQGEAPRYNVQHGGRMVVVNFRVPAEIKEAAVARAEREGINLTDALRDFLSEWSKG